MCLGSTHSKLEWADNAHIICTFSAIKEVTLWLINEWCPLDVRGSCLECICAQEETKYDASTGPSPADSESSYIMYKKPEKTTSKKNLAYAGCHRSSSNDT